MTRVVVGTTTVTREVGAWTPTVHRLLRHLGDRGIDVVPRPISRDDRVEVLSLVPGVAGRYPLSAEVRSASALRGAARMLRRIHDASADFPTLPTDHWMLPARGGDDVVICHGDFAPYNCTFDGDTLVGVFDFDAAHPAPRAWDIAYALYRFAPLADPADDADGATWSFDERLTRARDFCDEYGLDEGARETLPQLVSERLEALVRFMHDRANSGDLTFATNIADGHDLIYRRDADFITSIADELRRALTH